MIERRVDPLTGEEVVLVAGRQGRPNLPSTGQDAATVGPRSYTGEALEAVLAAGPLVHRASYDPHTEFQQQEGDLDISERGQHVKMPWQIDGRRWHCQDRVGRNGRPCRWDGRLLEQVVDRIQELGDFSDTNWNSRGVVEITVVAIT